MNQNEAEMLEQQGKKLLEERDFKGAEKAFAKALELQEETSYRNNLALSVYLQGEAERALQILEPYLNPGNAEFQPTPFSHALGAQLLATLGQEGRARQQLNAAIKLFEKGTAELRKQRVDMTGWQELDQEVERVVARAKRLREKGRLEEAIDLMEKFLQEGKYHPQAVLVLANLYRSAEELDKALPLLNMLEDILPGDPILLFNLAGLWLQRGDVKTARDYLKRVDLRGQSDELKEKYKLLQREIELRENLIYPEGLEDIMFDLEEKKRSEIEGKILPLDATLGRGLKNMPANWLEGMVDDYALKPARLRKDREQEVIRYLCQPRNLKKVLREDLDDEERELLRYLLERGGWARLGAVTRKFGSMEGDGFFWEEYIPDSSLGFLWSRGLVLVGRAKIDGRSTRFVTVPKELREPMASLLGAAETGAPKDDEEEKENIFVFKVTLTDAYGRVRGYPYRTIAIPEDFTLYELGETIIESFEFAFDHAFGFYDNIKRWTDSVEAYEYFTDIGESDDFPGVQKTRVAKVFREQGKKMLFLFDYGDEWRFIVHFKEVQEASGKDNYPAVLEKYGHVEQYE